MIKPSMIDSREVIRRIDAAEQVVITTHSRADGDAIGSAFALGEMLRQKGRITRVFLHENIPDRYAFLAGGAALEIWAAGSAAGVLAGADLLVVVDTCAANQLGDVADAIRAARLPKMAIDHHVTRDDIVDAVFARESAGACAQLIVELCDSAGWKLNPTAATLLFTGLATDTGWFRFSNADPAVFACAGRLAEAGARPNELYERLYLNETLPRARLMGAVLSSFELLAGGRLAVCKLTRRMLADCEATVAMTEDIPDEPQRLGSVDACVLLVEPPDDGPIRVSLRSKHLVDVSAVAARFGGGGHLRAAGAKVKGSLDDVTKQVTAAMLEELKGP